MVKPKLSLMGKSNGSTQVISNGLNLMAKFNGST
jgi:hypothetical protein